ncbi:putative signaling protein [Tepidimonas alkaliphilus]|uniref:Putative signaling protein n=1 Tax=Tepidimonas alkaliphilus TaxID=2588942 RepID=A0A554W8F6_9BURK|nr:EAL domain-containing protein [Tepidimonas alkaliphilus]TSE19854.1 putative signaling protein [Tepidimonas alkaliphilus]
MNRATLPRRAMFALAATCAWTLLGLTPRAARADPDELRIGVLAYRPREVEERAWAAVLQALQRRLPNLRLQARILDFPALDAAVRARELDVVITNPGHYVALRYSEGLSNALATVWRRRNGVVTEAFGGTVVVRADSTLQRWEDLRRRRVGVPHEESLAGWHLQRFELRRRGLADDDIEWVRIGMPQDNVVLAVLHGQVEAGFVRDGVLEALQASGRIPAGQLRVLQPQTLPGYPVAVSTPLVPEWPVAVLPSVDDDTRRLLMLALLQLHDDPALQQGELAGFVPPQNYAAVELVLRELRVRPFGVPQLTWRETLERHAAALAAATAGMLALLIGVAVLGAQRRRVRQALRDKSALLEELAITAKTFESSQGVLITDAAGRIVRVNQAFQAITGYTASEALGRTPGELLRSGRQDTAFYRAMWQALAERGYWEGEIWNRRKDGGIYPEWLTISAVTDAHGQVRHYVAIFADISWRKQAEAQIENLAFFDPLTGLANRRLLLDRLQQAVHQARRSARWGALLFLDLDHFKTINDTHGHDVGDAVLRALGERLRATLREQDTPGRLGGDEFLVLLPPSWTCRDEAALAARVVADKLAAALRQPVLHQDRQLALTLSIGIALYGDAPVEATELLKAADLAMYSVKQAGRNGVAFFDPEMEAAVRQRHQLQLELARAIDTGALQLYLQPQVDAGGRLLGAEALVRWPREDGTLMAPGSFIPLAEETGLIVPLGNAVLQQAAALLQRWQSEAALAGLRLSVNVSARQFRDPQLAEHVRQVIEQHRIPPQLLELEITESVFLGDLEAARRTLQALDALGVSLALDDFGTGYSSLAYLAELPFDTIKIDQRFVARLGQHSRQDEAIITTIIALGRQLQMQVLAEGVETEDQERYLLHHGCHGLQGYRYGRPMPVGQFEALARAQPTPPA